MNKPRQVKDGKYIKPPQTLTKDEVYNLLVELRSSKTRGATPYMRERNYLMALIMVDAGLRVGEVVGLLQSDLTIKTKPVKGLWLKAEITKNHLERLVPLSDRIQQQIQHMSATFWQSQPWEDIPFAFTTEKTSGHITIRRVQLILRQAGLHAIGRSVHPHVLRHTFATRMMHVTNVRVVQQLIGHKHLSSTQVYTHPTNDDLRDAIEAAQT